MPVMRQCGDPVCPDCLCQHHEEAYAELPEPINAMTLSPKYTVITDNTAVTSVQITTTRTCCITVNAAAILLASDAIAGYEIERPAGSIRTTQEDEVITGDLKLSHHAAWEVLPPGTYTYHLMNRSGTNKPIFAAWIKAIASDCEG